MSAYKELIKSFDRVRGYLREFYVYGFKTRSEYDAKSERSYDDGRRRLESWLGEHVGFVRTPEGKNVFISIDSRTVSRNPLFKAWKTCSFTDLDVTLHFILFDVLHSEDVFLSVPDITAIIDREYLDGFDEPLTFDESTVRKKLKEYERVGIVRSRREGKRTLYARRGTPVLPAEREYLDFFSEVAPCGVIGSFILDKLPDEESAFSFKHHYVTSTVDSGILATVFDAMSRRSTVEITYQARRQAEAFTEQAVPLRVFVSVQSGRQSLVCYSPSRRGFVSYRVDRILSARVGSVYGEFDALRQALRERQGKMWGVNPGVLRPHGEQTEHVEFTVRVNEGEEYIVNRLYREKRCGTVEKTGEDTYRFSADVYDTSEMIPWIRTFICRITRLNFSNRTLENSFKDDILKMYETYGVDRESFES